MTILSGMVLLMKRPVMPILIGVMLWSAFIAQAAPLKVGDAIPLITAKDQHGANYVFTNGTAYLLIVQDMENAKAANHKLAEQGGGVLEQHGAVYLMDIHTMPGIARFFALPKMRKYPQRIVLSDTPDALNWVPAKTGYATILKLTSAGHIEKISYWQATRESLKDVLR